MIVLSKGIYLSYTGTRLRVAPQLRKSAVLELAISECSCDHDASDELGLNSIQSSPIYLPIVQQ